MVTRDKRVAQRSQRDWDYHIDGIGVGTIGFRFVNGVMRGGSYMEGYQIRERDGYRLQLGKVSPSRNVGFRLLTIWMSMLC